MPRHRRRRNRPNVQPYHQDNPTSRSNVCWNCFECGHLRFQCPMPKQSACSFCRTPNVRTIECACRMPPRFEIPENEQIIVINYNEDKTSDDETVRRSEDEDADVLVIFAENEPLE